MEGILSTYFAPRGDGHGRGKLLWKYDCNPKTHLVKYVQN